LVEDEHDDEDDFSGELLYRLDVRCEVTKKTPLVARERP
jgi:hypothetical protein